MLPMGALVVTTEPGTEVWVEGERVGVAPLGAMAVPIGTRKSRHESDRRSAKKRGDRLRSAIGALAQRRRAPGRARCARNAAADGTIQDQRLDRQ
jgi:hypothetical protein